MTETLIIIIGMSLATYLTRVMPLLFLSKVNFSDNFKLFLQYIPFAALSALIYPAILSVNEQNPYIGLLGGVVAVVLSFFKVNIVVTMILSIMVTFLIS